MPRKEKKKDNKVETILYMILCYKQKKESIFVHRFWIML
jgi:hypothetical protein